MALSCIRPTRISLDAVSFSKDNARIAKRSPSALAGKWFADGLVMMDGRFLARASSLKNVHHATPLSDPSLLSDSIVAFPTLLFPMSDSIPGFLTFGRDDFTTKTLSPFLKFEFSDLSEPFKLGQYGPTIAEDMVLTYENTDGATFVLMAFRPGRKMATICGGGIRNINCPTGETGKRELYEEGVKHVPEEWKSKFEDALDAAKLVYAGPVWDDPRNSGNGWMETIAYCANIPDDMAESLSLGTTLDADGEIDVEAPFWMEITEENMEKYNIIECHRMILRRAIHCTHSSMRYCSSFEMPWTEDQLSRFQAVNLAQEDQHGLGKCSYDPKWARISSDDSTVILPILGPSGFDRVNFYPLLSATMGNGHPVIFWDPMNSKLNEENSTLCRHMEHTVILHPLSHPVFILPKDLEPYVTWDEMALVVEHDLVDCTSVFVEDGIPDELMAKIPDALRGKVVMYKSLDEVADTIASKFCL